jgi:hypothetical protein
MEHISAEFMSDVPFTVSHREGIVAWNSYNEIVKPGKAFVSMNLEKLRDTAPRLRRKRKLYPTYHRSCYGSA